MTSHPDTSAGRMDDLFRAYRQSGDRTVRNELVEAHRGLAASIANDYRGRGVELDDLVQIAMLGTLKAVERFDPARGIPFSSFASRTVNGEIKRYFRDRTWAVRPPRSAQERHLDLRRARVALSTRLGRPPTVTELASELEISTVQVLDALEAGAAYRATSLDARRQGDDDNSSLAERLPGDDAPSRPVNRTRPADAAWTGVPGSARMSIPRCCPAANGSEPRSNAITTSPATGHAHDAALRTRVAALRCTPTTVGAAERQNCR